MTEAILEQVYRHVPNVPLTMISQGAEALVFLSSIHPYTDEKASLIVKYRPPKPYRHPKIDALLTKSRTIAEAKFMAKLLKLNIPAPALVLLDAPKGVICMTKIGADLADGSVSSLKNFLWWLEKSDADPYGAEAEAACTSTGAIIGKLHAQDMIHGDLTTSNIMLHDGQAHLIDFGLSLYSALAEDKAVDLYVLERAVNSTHSEFADKYNEWLLQGYQSAVPKGKLKDTMKKLEDVRLRGRKRSMLG